MASTFGARGGATYLRYAILDIEKVRPHEQTSPRLLETLLDAILADGFLRRPILVEDESLVILDGHHRHEALRRLGCRRVPVYLVPYDDPAIGLTTWPDAVVTAVTKAEVVARGRRGDLFPPKTTRHLVELEYDEVHIPLEELR